jgi:hypothetical protein
MILLFSPFQKSLVEANFYLLATRLTHRVHGMNHYMAHHLGYVLETATCQQVIAQVEPTHGHMARCQIGLNMPI